MVSHSSLVLVFQDTFLEIAYRREVKQSFDFPPATAHYFWTQSRRHDIPIVGLSSVSDLEQKSQKCKVVGDWRINEFSG